MARTPPCRKARERVERAADRLAMELLGIATSADNEGVRLAAIGDALDRAGLNPKTAVEVEVSTKPYQRIFEGIALITRAESRARRGLPATPAPHADYRPEEDTVNPLPEPVAVPNTN